VRQPRLLKLVSKGRVGPPDFRYRDLQVAVEVAKVPSLGIALTPGSGRAREPAAAVATTLTQLPVIAPTSPHPPGPNAGVICCVLQELLFVFFRASDSPTCPRRARSMPRSMESARSAFYKKRAPFPESCRWQLELEQAANGGRRVVSLRLYEIRDFGRVFDTQRIWLGVATALAWIACESQFTAWLTRGSIIVPGQNQLSVV
jgi:hypothetical protein